MRLEGFDPEIRDIGVAYDFYDAMVAYNERTVFGEPATTTGELPVWYMEAIYCVERAKAAADQELRRQKEGFAGNELLPGEDDRTTNREMN